jgi:murein DD-endopeptidase MepM/ murein hydrolase activator NlpD
LLNIALVGVMVGLLWLLVGQRFWRFVTGQDIIDEVAVEAAVDGESSQPTSEFAPEAPVAVTEEENLIVERSAEPYTDVPERGRRQVIRYEVQEGDTIFGLAERFELDPDNIFWANTETLQDNIHLIYVGVPLYILPADGVYHTATGEETITEIAGQFGVTPQVILNSAYNSLPSDDVEYLPPRGQRLVIEGGRREYISWASPIVYTGNEGATSPEAIDIHPGACRSFYTGIGGTGTYANPLGNITYKVTNGFFPFHPGVDLSVNPGTPVYAADSGVVVFAGRHSGGYGTLIILDHGSDATTYYAHLLSRYVECGQSVTRGEAIGEVGSTGFSSGAHLHFEVRREHEPQSPYLYFDIIDSRFGT